MVTTRRKSIGGIEARSRARVWDEKRESWPEISRFRCYQGWAMAPRIFTSGRSALNWVFADETMMIMSLSGEEVVAMLLLRMDYCERDLAKGYVCRRAFVFAIAPLLDLIST